MSPFGRPVDKKAVTKEALTLSEQVRLMEDRHNKMSVYLDRKLRKLRDIERKYEELKASIK